jgi:hypothetical protein
MKLKHKTAFVLFGLTGGVLAYSQSRRIKAEVEKAETVMRANVEKPILELKGSDLGNYPWADDLWNLSLPEDWEFRRVRVRGELAKSTHFVYRERNGEKGYLVFKTLITARQNPINMNKVKSKTEASQLTGMMVNLGWVAEKDAFKVGTGEVTYLKKCEVDEEAIPIAAQIINPRTGVVHNAVTDDEDVEFIYEGYDADEVILTGYLRKNEEPSIWQGRRYWRKENFTSVVDLEKLTATYGLTNLVSARKYYLEVALNRKLDRVKKTNIVIPSTFKESKEEITDYIRGRAQEAVWYRKLGVYSSLAMLGLSLI